jgi:hypothetical protein
MLECWEALTEWYSITSQISWITNMVLVFSSVNQAAYVDKNNTLWVQHASKRFFSVLSVAGLLPCHAQHAILNRASPIWPCLSGFIQFLYLLTFLSLSLLPVCSHFPFSIVILTSHITFTLCTVCFCSWFLIHLLAYYAWPRTSSTKVTRKEICDVSTFTAQHVRAALSVLHMAQKIVSRQKA